MCVRACDCWSSKSKCCLQEDGFTRGLLYAACMPMPMLAHAHIYKSTHICAGIHVHASANKLKCAHTGIYICTRTHTRIHMYTHTHTCTHVNIFIQACACTDANSRDKNSFLYIADVSITLQDVQNGASEDSTRDANFCLVRIARFRLGTTHLAWLPPANV